MQQATKSCAGVQVCCATCTQQAMIDTEALCSLHQEEELRQLVRLVSEHHCFSQEDYEEALSHALRDPVNALTCFASMAHKLTELRTDFDKERDK